MDARPAAAWKDAAGQLLTPDDGRVSAGRAQGADGRAGPQKHRIAAAKDFRFTRRTGRAELAQNFGRQLRGTDPHRRSGAVACPSAYGRQKAPGLSLQGQATSLSAQKAR